MIQSKQIQVTVFGKVHYFRATKIISDILEGVKFKDAFIEDCIEYFVEFLGLPSPEDKSKIPDFLAEFGQTTKSEIFRLVIIYYMGKCK